MVDFAPLDPPYSRTADMAAGANGSEPVSPGGNAGPNQSIVEPVGDACQAFPSPRMG